MFSWLSNHSFKDNLKNLRSVIKSRIFFTAFFGFWLTILSIFLLLVLFVNLHTETTEAKPLNHRHHAHLTKYAKNIKRLVTQKARSIEEAISHPKLSRHTWLVLLNENIDKSVSSKENKLDLNLSLLPIGPDLEPMQIRTSRYVAFGPLTVTLNQDTYQLYQIRPFSRPLFLHSVRVLPTWLKLTAILLPSLFLSLCVTAYLVSPLKHLSNRTRQLAQGDMSARVKVPKSRHDEVASLMRDFNEMAEQLTQSIQAHKQLLADVSHELRSPLTRLSLANAMAQDLASDGQKTYLSRVEQEANCLDDMLENILTLSRLEYASQPLQQETITLHTLLHALLTNAQFEAEQANKRLDVTTLPECELRCDGALICCAVENILRNAIKYAQQKIILSVSADAQFINITIRDDGDGVCDDALNELGNAFYRTDGARSRQTGGFGLGLAIANRAVLAHHGALNFSHNQPHGLTVTISLPL